MRAVLENGLTVLLQENHTARVAALQLWVKVGSADETEEEAGLAHLHEHMLFKGTERRGPGEIARSVEQCGGDVNAWTSFDQTVYHLVLASDFFDEGLDILADAVTASVFDPGELSREIEVVCEEIRRAEDMPSRRISRNLFGLAYDSHPYKRPVIGYERTVRSFTRERILDFYGRHYTAPNMCFVAVGDFDEKVALEAVRRRFADVRQTPPGRRAARGVEPLQHASRATVETAPVHEAYLSAGWHIPGLTSPDVAALDLISVLLGQGDSSRLTLEVKRERGLVNEVYSSAYTPQDPGLLIVGASLPHAQLRPALAELLAQTYRLRREEVEGEELARAKRMLESETIFQRETVQGQARKLGFFETVAGGIEEEERYLAAVAATTPAEIRAAAERYLTDANLSISAIVPADVEGLPAEAELLAIGREVEAKLDAKIQPAPARPYPRLSAAEGSGARREHKDAVRERLPNGVQLLVKEDHTVPLVSIRAVWVGGLRAETTADNGVNYLLARSLLRGTQTRGPRELAREIDDLAGGVGGASGRNSYGVRGEFLSADIERAFDLFADVLLRPALAHDEIEKEKALIVEEIRARDDNPGSAVFALFGEALFDHHPYRLEANGTEASLGGLDAAAVRRWQHAHYRLDGLTLAVVGDITFARARALALEHLSGGPQGRGALPHVALEAPLAGPRDVKRRLDRKQAHLLIGFRGTTVSSPDRYALQVMSAILSGQGGRLFLELRDKRSMAYSVTSMVSEGLDPGYIAVYMGTSPEKVPDAKAGIWRELEKIRDEPVGAAELERAQRHLVGSHEIGLQRMSARAAVIALDEAYGLGAESHQLFAQRTRAVTAAEIQRVARAYLDPERSVTALVSPDA